MSTSRPTPPGTVPTLTEVVSWPAGDKSRAMSAAPAAATSAAATNVPTGVSRAPAAALPAEAPALAPTAVPGPTEEELAKRVIGDLQRQIDLMLDVRLKEALAPILTRATDALVRDVRNQLTATLRDVVTRAVAKEMNRPPRK